MWVDTTGTPMDEAAIRAAHPDTLFPATFSPPDGYAPVEDGPVPGHTR